MGGLRPGSGHVARVTKAILAAVLLGGALTLAAAATATEAGAFSATPQWFTTGGTAVSSLSCDTWYYTTMGPQTGGGSASSPSTAPVVVAAREQPVGLGNTANTAAGVRGGQGGR